MEVIRIFPRIGSWRSFSISIGGIHAQRSLPRCVYKDAVNVNAYRFTCQGTAEVSIRSKNRSIVLIQSPGTLRPPSIMILAFGLLLIS